MQGAQAQSLLQETKPSHAVEQISPQAPATQPAWYSEDFTYHGQLIADVVK